MRTLVRKNNKMYFYHEPVRMETSNAGEQLAKCQNQVRTENKAGILRNAAFSFFIFREEKTKKTLL